jgi:hypothetical protein
VERAELADILFRAARRYVEDTPRTSQEGLARVVYVQLCRPGRPGGKLSDVQREALRLELTTLAKQAWDLTDPGQLSRFTAAAAATSLTRAPRGRHKRPVDEAMHSRAQLARMALLSEYSAAKDGNDLVRKAVTRAIRERRKGAQRGVRLDVEDGDPLRELLDLPRHGEVRLPRTDLRAHLTRALQKDGSRSSLPGILRRAARFSEKTLRPALGEELWALCRPVGFSDDRGRRLSIEVVGASFAHEAHMRRNELLHRLQAVPGFEEVKELRFLVPERSTLPIVGTR